MASMRLSKSAWRECNALYQYSQTARYDGITDFETFEKLKQVDYRYCLKHLDNFKKYLKTVGL